MSQVHRFAALINRVPPHAFFLNSALFHYLGPAFAVLLFRYVDVLGVAWLRIASAAVVFALWRRPWRVLPQLPSTKRKTLLLLGIVLAAMNGCFYLAINTLPLGTVGAIEFVGPITLAAIAVRTYRNFIALACAALGVYLLTDIWLYNEPLGFAFAFANCGLFVLYVILGHRIAQDENMSSIDRLGVSMIVALIAFTPFGISSATPAFLNFSLLTAGFGVGICSSVIPYVCDQLAMARLPRATFALLLSLLPATATIIGILVLRQIPSMLELAGIAFVVVGVSLHRTT